LLCIGTIIVEYRDHGTRCGWNSITTPMQVQGRHIMDECSKWAPQAAMIDLDDAFKHFFRKTALKKQGQFQGKGGSFSRVGFLMDQLHKRGHPPL
jgi:hypothetical protein